MKVKAIKLPDGTIAEIPDGATLHEFRRIAGRIVKEAMRACSMLILTKGFEAMEAERDKWKPYAKYLSYA